VVLAATPCTALECPAPQHAGASGVTQETPGQIAELSQVLASGDLGDRIPVYVHVLRSHHPDAGTGDLVNYLVMAYCKVANSLSGLSDDKKQARMDAFALQVAQAAY
jgi:hypothetical protein